MAIKSFKVENIKAVALAECDSVPRVMILAGPNGVGKSTLLYELSQQRGVSAVGETQFLYHGPHRAIRRTTIQRRWLGGVTKFFSQLLSSGDVSGYEGLQIQNSSRTPDNIDEAGSTIKHTLGKIENKKQTAFSQLVDRNIKINSDKVDISKVPNIYEPLKELTKYLLPHLEFDRIDFTNEDNIKCIWTRKDKHKEFELDIDDLSSGEKSIIILFFPLLENDINKRLQIIEQIQNPAIPTEPIKLPDRVFIIDEPELHLHPDLQARLLSYIRELSHDADTQFIISTHSPTILDQALDDELFFFSPPDEGSSKNQIKKIATNIERLEALKQLAGNTYLVTTGRSIICIEGDDNTTTKPADIRLLEILYPRATAFTFVPSGGKGNVIKTVQQLRDYLPKNPFGIHIYGLVDKDQKGTSIDGIYDLPVCMIENLLLLDEKALHTYLVSIKVKTYTNELEVKNELKEIAKLLKNDEIKYRIMRQLKAHTVRISGLDEGELKAKLQEEIENIKTLLPEDEKLKTLIDVAKGEVESILDEGNELKYFRGKDILNAFYHKHVQSKNISYASFCYELAKVMTTTKNVEEYLNPLFDTIEEANKK